VENVVFCDKIVLIVFFSVCKRDRRRRRLKEAGSEEEEGDKTTEQVALTDLATADILGDSLVIGNTLIGATAMQVCLAMGKIKWRRA
jgi:hypothetical protein